MGNNLKLKREAKDKSWPFIKPADKLSFLNTKIDIKHNLVDLVGQTAWSALGGNYNPNWLDKARFDIDVDLGEYGLGFEYKKDDYKLTVSKDLDW